MGKPYNRPFGRGKSAPPLVPTAPPSPRCEACHTILRSLTLPYESCSLATPLLGRATKGKRLYGQARRLTSPDLHILCRMCTVGLWVLCNVPHVSTGKHRGNLPLRGRRRHRRQKGCISHGRRPVVRFPLAPWGGFEGFIIRGASFISQAPSFLPTGI